MDADEDDWSQDGAEMRAKVEALEAAILASPGYAANQRWSELSRSWTVFGETVHELIALLVHGETNDEMIVELFQNVRPPIKRDAYIRALDAKLEGSTAALSALVDVSTHLLRDNYSGTDFYDEYLARNKKVVTPDAIFLGNLRNYLQHYKHAPWQWIVRPGTGLRKSSAEINLHVEELLKWSGWSAGTKKYLADHAPDVRLSPIIIEYVNQMQVLWTWLFEQYETLHGGDVDGVNELVRQKNLALTNGAHDGRNMQSFWRHAAENHARVQRGEPQVDWQDVKDLPENQD